MIGRGQPGDLGSVYDAARMCRHVRHGRRLTCSSGRGHGGRVVDLPSRGVCPGRKRPDLSDPHFATRKGAEAAPIPVRVVPGVVDSLGLGRDSVDAVVVCGVLCSVPDQGDALAEFRRVLRPGGELRLYEHVRSPRQRASGMVIWMAVKLQRHALGVTWVEQNAMARAAHALLDDRRVWLIDPYEDADALAAVAELGTPAGVLQLLDRHNRDCERIAQRLGVPLMRLPADGAGTPFEVIAVISNRVWREVALWWPEQRALVVAEAVGTAPAFALGRPAGVHPMLRLMPPRKQLSRVQPERLLVGHGEAIESGASAALRDALAQSRSDIPRLLLSVPKLLRGG